MTACSLSNELLGRLGKLTNLPHDFVLRGVVDCHRKEDQSKGEMRLRHECLSTRLEAGRSLLCH
jgi:hypothetical protein